MNYGMIDEIFENLKAEIAADEAQADKVNDALLRSKITSAYRDVKKVRRYPSTYSEERIDADMIDYYSNVESIARYDYNLVGAEGQTQYSADGTSVHFLDRDKLFYGVYPIAK